MCLPKEGESLCGDAAVTRTENGVTLVCVIDVLGHGAAAAAVAETGSAFLATVRLDRDARYVIEALHDALRGTRGAAAMCCLLKGGRIDGCGVGNVELRSSARVPVVMTPGILGVSLQRTRVFEGALPVGSRLLLFSDGLSPRISLDGFERMDTERACKSLMNRYRRGQDDATVLVADVQAESD